MSSRLNSKTAISTITARYQTSVPKTFGAALGVGPGDRLRYVIEGLGHGLGRASDAPQLEREQGAQGIPGGDHAASRQGAVGGEGVDVDPGEIGGKQEQAAKVGAQAPGREIRTRFSAAARPPSDSTAATL